MGLVVLPQDASAGETQGVPAQSVTNAASTTSQFGPSSTENGGCGSGNGGGNGCHACNGVSSRVAASSVRENGASKPEFSNPNSGRRAMNGGVQENGHENGVVAELVNGVGRSQNGVVQENGHENGVIAGHANGVGRSQNGGVQANGHENGVVAGHANGVGRSQNGGVQENGHENGVAAGLSNGVGRSQNGAVQEAHRPAVVGLQPVALVDHVARVDWSLLEAVPGERGGSMRVSEEELDHILREVNLHFLMGTNATAEHGVKTLAGGSVANTIRGLAQGLGVETALVGVRGCDDRGQMFAENMAHAGVDLSRLRAVPGLTAQCACLVDAEGNRTMRPCFLNAVRLEARELTRNDFKGAKWVVLNGYGFYGEDLLENAVDICKEEGVKVSMDLASFEVVRNFRPRLMRLLESGKVDLAFANEDEAGELIKGEENPCPETCLNFLSKYCERAVVMLGSKGCIARHGTETVRVPAIRETNTVDTTGAGDLFASGFLYGVLNHLSLEDCCKMGCCTGGAVVRGLGGEVGEEGWAWMQQQLKLKNLPPIKGTSPRVL